MPGKITVVLLFGGRSSEHSISCATAGGVLEAIDRSRFDVIPVGITREGAFVLEDDDPAKFRLDVNALPQVLDNGTRILWPDSIETRELSVRSASGDGAGDSAGGESVRSLGDVDVVFPILHGPYGEDGTVQGLLELIGLSYVGSGVLASALGMDKHYTKTVLEKAGIAVAPWRTLTAREWATSPEAITASASTLGLPLFVKPARAGSSVGVSKVSSLSELPAAIDVALREDSRVLIEQGIAGREVECGVLGGRGGTMPRVSVAGEIVMTTREFYDFDAKYLDAPGVELVCPAALTPEELATMQSLAARAFTAIDGAGLARVDFFLTPTGFVVNEINTMPGFTPISMFPKCWIASGLSYPEIIDELIALALEA
ncbi:D-alanine--D-alanine ligase [Herbiconiux sp. CPCC 205763]|uniref:D-alanine--D-alanine ligase n=1 Tax=Herbiconiux aconitum TaxID=2970913 RepID=A0ABT2GRV3_9MICO|nr:D-alanine--D-alanine ligase family protein [Herbiconiux aconitum]MCS5718893.1 D-alanine--D-alanine ligase [Herbiconiux aconitum]